MTQSTASGNTLWDGILAKLRESDRSTAMALAAVVKASEPTNRATLHDVAVAELGVRLDAGRSADHAETGRLDEIREHLARTALPRLVSIGAIEAVPAGEGGMPAWRLAASVVDALGTDADAVVQAIRALCEQTMARKATLPRVEGSSVLAGEHLVKTYRRRSVVNNVDVEVRQGEIVGLLGPNGAGKTTTFYMIVGLIPPNSGRILFDGDDITNTPMYRRARRGIGYLSQEPSIFRKLTVEENILAILETLAIDRDERATRLESLLDELGIKHLRRSKAYSLSGGERRRLEITRALVTQPKFMLLDEPFAGVDPIAVHDIQQIVASLKDRGIGVLITDHNVEQTLDIVDRAYILFDGQIKVSGTVRELVFDDEVAHLYLGPTLTARLRGRFLAEHGAPA